MCYLKKLSWSICLLISSLLYLTACSKMDFAGSRDEVQSKLNASFPSGMSKDEVVSALATKYGIAPNQMSFSHTAKNSIRASKSGKPIEIYSWLTANLGEYRSARHIFAKTSVAAQFNFDQGGNLVSIQAIVASGPEM